MVHIRLAAPCDTAAMTEMYNHGVRHSTALWATETVTTAQCQDWLQAQQKQNFPVFVACDDQNHFLGYSYYTPWMPYYGYRYSVEDSVYVSEDYQRRGIGTALLSHLIEHAQQQRLHVLVAGIDAANTASLQLHKKLGFIKRGTLPQVATKFGAWLDLTYMTYTLDT